MSFHPMPMPRCIPFRKVKLLGAMLLAASTLAASSALAAVGMNVSIDTVNSASKPDSTIPKEVHSAMEVILADDYIAVKSPRQIVVYDFKSRRRLVGDTASRTYVDYSLFDVVGFRVLEFNNRIAINAALGAAKLAAMPNRTVDTEQALSIEGRTPSKIEQSASAGERLFASDQKPLAAWSKSGAPVAAADAARYANFLRYTLGGHPQVLKQLAAGAMVPDKLVLSTMEMWGLSTSTVTATAVQPLAGATAGASAIGELKGYALRKAALTSDAVDTAMDTAANWSPQQLAALRAAHPVELVPDPGASHLLDALLGALEGQLMTGTTMPPYSAELVKKLQADQSVLAFFGAMAANTPETYAEAVKTLVSLREQAPNKAYMLKLFEANDRIKLRQPGDSLKLFDQVLRANPLLAGAYKDLGDLLLLQFDSARAWRSWDAGRRLAPTLPNFVGVTQFETELAKQHPEYF